MSYENIQHPDKHQFEDGLRHQLFIAQQELAYLRQKYKSVCDDLRTIIERAEKGETVYVVMPDKSRLYLAKANGKEQG